MTDWARAYTWGLDFSRALVSRPWWARMLFRIACGRYAYREFVGMQDCFYRDGFGPRDAYELQHMEYHGDRVPDDIGKERDPTPLGMANVIGN